MNSQPTLLQLVVFVALSMHLRRHCGSALDGNLFLLLSAHLKYSLNYKQDIDKDLIAL